MRCVPRDTPSKRSGWLWQQWACTSVTPREVARAAQERIVLQTVDSRQVSSGAFPSTAPMHPPASPGTTMQADLRSAKEIAEAFTATQNTNPLFRPRSPE